MIAQGSDWQVACQRLIGNGRLQAMRIYKRNQHPDLPAIKRPWAVTTSSRILLLQALVFLFLAWLEAPRAINPSFEESWLALLFFFLCIYALLASLNFLRMYAPARNRAMLVQAFNLSLMLILYGGSKPVFMFPLMVLSVFIVMYLQHPDVRESFPYEFEHRKEKVSE